MSGSYDNMGHLPSTDYMEPGFGVFDNPYGATYTRMPGASAMDGYAFWYRPPETIEPLYDSSPSVFSRSVSIPTNTMETSSVKHRRTRSGCFTCRTRRVKCDETRPVCDRCKKGNRECEFPPLSSTSKRSKQSLGDQLGHEVKDAGSTSLETIKDEDESEDLKSPTSPSSKPRSSKMRGHDREVSAKNHRSRQSPESPSDTKDKASASPQSVGTSSSQSNANTPASSRPTTVTPELALRPARWKHLKPDMQRYLQFQLDHLTYYHYFLKHDPSDFVHGDLIDLALGYEPLLYAVVAFAAYHYTLQQPEGKLGDFLGYYSKSLTLLRKSIEKQSKINETNQATLLTILQLALFEEYLGDFVNLAGHIRAAHSMLLQLYTVESIMASDLSRRIFDMYTRFDVLVSLMAGNETSLPREWYSYCAEWHKDQIDTDPNNDIDLEGYILYFAEANRLLGFDMASLFSSLPKGKITLEVFIAENENIKQRLQQMKLQIQSLNDEYYTVQEYPVAEARPLNDEDIVNPYIPGGLFRDVLWPMNAIWIDWYAIEMMQTYQTSIIMRQSLPEHLESLAMEQCRIYDAMDRWPDAPEGCILGVHASLGLATIFLKKDYKHTMWARRKLAGVERLGYVFPITFRKRMADMWRASEGDLDIGGIEDWWLPNDEGRLPILKDVRSVVEERNEATKRMGGDGKQDIRDLKAIFANLNIRAQVGVEASPTDTTGSTSGASPQSASEASGTPRGSVSGSVSSRGHGRRRSSVKTDTTPKDSNRMSGIWDNNKSKDL